MREIFEALGILKKREQQPKTLGAIAREHMFYPMPSTMKQAYVAVQAEARKRGDTRSDESLFFMIIIERIGKCREEYAHDPAYSHRLDGAWEEIMIVGKELGFVKEGDTVEMLKQQLSNQMRVTPTEAQLMRDRA
jgi:hypothetical protein